MSTFNFSWQRFWIPRGDQIWLSPDGFLADPQSEWGSLNPTIMGYEDLEEIPCLILLGEPGMGKSTALWDAYQSSISHRGSESSLWIDLKNYQTDVLLLKDITEHPYFVSWLTQENHLCLFLDSLDECLANIRTITNLIASKLSTFPINRLSIRIACRTAEWPLLFESHLTKLWPESQMQIYELAPLRRSDVASAATIYGIDPDAFLNEAIHREAVPLAFKPVTLNFLLRTYKRNGGLPRTQRDLYSRGCELLCEETSQSRLDAGIRGQLTAQRRMSIAAHIAAITVLSNHAAVWTGVDLGDVPSSDLLVQDLTSEQESVADLRDRITDNQIRETLATGLFSVRGGNRIGWSHQTYAEFLTAHYIAASNIELPQIMSILMHPQDNRVVPQLREVAAWLSTMRQEVLQSILRTDPEVLLRGDLANTVPEVRTQLTATLLTLYDHGEILDRDWDIRKHYRKLSHDGLANQLRPYIIDSSKNFVVRRVAVDIAEACAVTDLLDDLVAIALAQGQSIHDRVNATHAVLVIGDSRSKQQLKPLALGAGGCDPDKELKGYALQAVWPEFMTAEELFGTIDADDSRLIGGYSHFLTSELLEELPIEDLPVALRWVEKQDVTINLSYGIRDLIDRIIVRAWEHSENTTVLEALASAVWSRIQRHEELIDMHSRPSNVGTFSDDEKRRRLLSSIVETCCTEVDQSSLLLFSRPRLVQPQDILWIIVQLTKSLSEQSRLIWASLVNRGFDVNNAKHTDAILVASLDSEVLAQTMKYWLTTVNIESAEAERMRNDYQRARDIWEGPPKDDHALDPPASERIQRHLEQIDLGRKEEWWKVCLDLELEPTSTRYLREFDSDLTNFYGWKNADQHTRERITAGAFQYLFNQAPDLDILLNTNNWHRPTYAGYKALRLLLTESATMLRILPPSVWYTWAPVILMYPGQSEVNDHDAQSQLIRIAYEYSPEAIIQILSLLIEKEDQQRNSLYRVGWVQDCWDERIAEVLLDSARSPNLSPPSLGTLLHNLLHQEAEEAQQFAKSLVQLLLPIGGAERKRALVASRELLQHAADIGWSTIWQVFQDDPEFGEEVIESLAVDPSNHNISHRLTEAQLADFYIWLQHRFPESEDPGYNSGWELTPLTPRHEIADLRNSILTGLRNKGSYEACDEIRRIIAEFPDLSGLRWVLDAAQELARQSTWVPLQPNELLSLLMNPHTRLIQHGGDLLNVLIETLDLLQANLHGETPAVAVLWNYLPDGSFRPKDELHLSDYVKRHLSQHLSEKGIVVNREVEIRRGMGATKGEETDIHVDAVINARDGQTVDMVSAIIEVKGNWNDNLYKDMENQLVKRYLHENRCQNGLYLVGWFNCSQWDKDDPRWKKARKITVEAAQQKLDEQAHELSQGRLRVSAYVMNTALR